MDNFDQEKFPEESSSQRAFNEHSILWYIAVKIIHQPSIPIFISWPDQHNMCAGLSVSKVK